MAAIKVNLSFDEDFIARVDIARKSLNLTRSAFLAMATNKYMQAEIVSPQLNSVFSQYFRDMADKLSGSISEEEYIRRAAVSDSEIQKLKASLSE